MDEFEITMHISSFEKLKNYKTLTDSERDEIVAYIHRCENKIHQLQHELKVTNDTIEDFYMSKSDECYADGIEVLCEIKRLIKENL